MNKISEQQIQFKYDKIFLEFLTIEPSLNWDIENLDSYIPDDRILATCIELTLKKKDITLVTADLALKLKAKSKSIKTFELDSTYRLIEKRSKEMKENIELREKLKKFENVMPNLSIKLNTSEELSSFANFSIKKKSKYLEGAHINSININQMKT